MKYIVYKNDVEVYESYDADDIDDFVQEQENPYDYNVMKVFACKGCGEYHDDVQLRYDAYGIETGYYCENCYETNYPYRKDRYPTMEYHGYGEQLYDEY
jgi:hypothetical protein